LHHNFLTQNPSRSSKVSKDSDCSLVSSKSFSEILPPNGWRPRPGKVGQGGLKVLHLQSHSQKARTPRAKIFFPVQKTCHVFWDFIGSVEHTGEIPVQSHVHLGVFFRKFSNSSGRQRVIAHVGNDAREWQANMVMLT